MENIMIKKLISTTQNDSAKPFKISLKPSTFLRKVHVDKTAQKKLSLRGYTSKNYFSKEITHLYKEMRDVYGNMPLWINYSVFPTAVSWNLDNILALHNIHVYGEEDYVNEFLSRFKGIIKNSKMNFLTDGIDILDKGFAILEDKTESEEALKLLPSEVQKSSTKSILSSDILNASGLIAGLAGIALTLSLLSRKKSNNQKHNQISREKALQAAVNCVSRFTSSTPVLRGEEFAKDRWRFTISNYTVTVNNKGLVTEIKEVKEDA